MRVKAFWKLRPIILCPLGQFSCLPDLCEAALIPALYETTQSGQHGLLKMSCMDLIHCIGGIYFNNFYWWTPLGAFTTQK
jgi:hypothetical protein